MSKKILKLIRTLSILAIWTVIYTYCVRFLILKSWQFDIMSSKSWHIISSFWTSGGVIKTGRDYFFAFSLLLIIPIWYMGLKKIFKIGIVKVLLSPVYLFNKIFAPKNDGIPSVKLKNMGAFKKESFEDIVNKRLNAKAEETSHAKDIRKNIKDKLKSIN